MTRLYARKTWHQLLRMVGVFLQRNYRPVYDLMPLWPQPLGQSGVRLARDALQLEKGTIAFMIVQSMAAFFLSALTHTGGDYAINGSFDKSGPTFQFFLSQPAAILIEEIAIRGARCLRSPTRVRVRIPRLVWRGVGYLWVGLWFTWCTPPWLDAVTASGGNVRTRLIPIKMLEKLV